MKIPFFKANCTNNSEELESTLLQTFRKQQYINGPEVKTLEKELQNYLSTPHCIACANGSDALLIALSSLELPKGSEVIIPTFNYISGAEAAQLLGLKVVFCNVDTDSHNTNLELIQKKWSDKTAAVLITHLFGLPLSDIEQIANYCKEKEVYLIEDNAQSFGSEVNNKKCGTFGDISITSFFPTKNLGGAGDGGAIFTSSGYLALKCRALASHGQTKKYHFKHAGYNSRLDTLQAALLLIKLKQLDQDIEIRKDNAQIYLEQLSTIPSLKLSTTINHTYNQFTINTDKRDELKSFLSDNGISTMVYYPLALHEQIAFLDSSYLDLQSHSCKKVLSLPIYPGLETKEILYICDCIKEFYLA